MLFRSRGGRAGSSLIVVRHPAELLAAEPDLGPAEIEPWAAGLLEQLGSGELVRADDDRLPRTLAGQPAVAADAPLLPPLDEAVIDACLAAPSFARLCARLGLEPDPALEAIARARAVEPAPHDPAQSAFIGRCLLRRFAGRHGWRYRIARGDPFGTPPRERRDPYVLLNPDATAGLGGLALSQNKRFGNLLAQLVHAFAVAERVGLTRIYLPEPHPLLTPLAGAAIAVTDAPPEAPNILSGEFFRRSALLRDIDAAEREAMLARHVRPLFNRWLEPLRPAPVDLTIHLRSGDVFNRRNVPADYAQPPLAYYLKILELVRPQSVRIVYEDRGNPVAKVLPGRCAALGLQVETQSSDLLTDVAAIFHAERAVLSRGTFGWAIADLSPHLREIFHFGTDHSARGTLPGVRLRSLVDLDGSYTRALMSGNWKKTPEQKAMMIDYPVTAIGEPGDATPAR